MMGSGLGPLKVGPGAITRTGPPSIRDARELFVTAKKGKNAVHAKTYTRFEQYRS